MQKDIAHIEKYSSQIKLSGRLTARSVGSLWEPCVKLIQSGLFEVDCSEVDFLDGGGASLFMMMHTESRKKGKNLQIKGLKSKFKENLELYSVEKVAEKSDPVDGRGFYTRLIENFGDSGIAVARDMRSQIEFLGECVLAFITATNHRRLIRWKDFWLICEKVGVDGLPIIVLVGFLMGLIMSFQSATSLIRFGAEIYVPNMLGLVMFRELGPLVTAILLAGRTGSAFAAEIGTMKVNEELDALTTMGLNPIRFLVLPRMLATIFVMPVLTLFFNFLSLVGGSIVMLSMGYPLTTFTSRVFSYVGWNDFSGGMIKAVVFSLLVAAIGCQRGLRTKSGATAVGDSTTSSVVSGIILIAFFDGLFAVLFYYVGF